MPNVDTQGVTCTNNLTFDLTKKISIVKADKHVVKPGASDTMSQHSANTQPHRPLLYWPAPTDKQ